MFQVMQDVSHPNLVSFIDCHLMEKELWIAMELLEGGSLTDVAMQQIMSEGLIAAVSRLAIVLSRLFN